MGGNSWCGVVGVHIGCEAHEEVKGGGGGTPAGGHEGREVVIA